MGKEPPTSTGPAKTLARRVNELARTTSDALIWRRSNGHLDVAPIGRSSLDLPLQGARPIREIPNYRGRDSFTGSYWFSQTRGLVEHESMAERLAAMMIDYYEDVLAITPQPMLIVLDDAPPRVPDFWTVHADATRCVYDVKHDEDTDEHVLAQFRRTAIVCARLGWRYALIPAPPKVFEYNLEKIAGYRQPHYIPCEAVLDATIEYCRTPREIGEVADMLSPTSRGAVVSAVYSLMWHHVLEPLTLEVPMDWHSLVASHASLTAFDLADIALVATP
jgi:hypothetical protein